MRFDLRMAVLGLIYLVLSVFIFFLPEQFFYWINLPSSLLPSFEPLAFPNERLTTALAATYGTTLAILCLMSAQMPDDKSYFFIHLVAKLVGVCAFFYLFFKEKQHLAYFFGGTFDAGVAVLLIASSVKKPGKKSKAH